MLKNPYRDHIIVNPLMRGGILPPEVGNEFFAEWGRVGYAVCYDCLEGRSSLCGKPPVKKFLERVAAFFGGDAAEHTLGCRAAQFAVMRAVSESLEGGREATGTVIADPTSHYSTNIAAEMNGLRVAEFPHSGYPEYTYSPGDYENAVLRIRDETGRLPALAVVTHADPYYGNIAPVAEIGSICRNLGVPLMLNAAYTGGVMPINMKSLNVDFLTLSAHKSMMSVAPLGFAVTTHEWADRLFGISKTSAAWTGRAFGKKIPNLFGCSIGGLPLISVMEVFPYVEERVARWDEELRKSNEFAEAIEDIGDIMLLGQRPHKHHLLHFETPRLWEVCNTTKDKGFYLAEFMIRRGIAGLHRGLSKHIKLSVYGLSDEERQKVLEAFRELATSGNGRIAKDSAP